jgi:hypothetical protein
MTSSDSSRNGRHGHAQLHLGHDCVSRSWSSGRGCERLAGGLRLAEGVVFLSAVAPHRDSQDADHERDHDDDDTDDSARYEEWQFRLLCFVAGLRRRYHARERRVTAALVFGWDRRRLAWRRPGEEGATRPYRTAESRRAGCHPLPAVDLPTAVGSKINASRASMTKGREAGLCGPTLARLDASARPGPHQRCRLARDPVEVGNPAEARRGLSAAPPSGSLSRR